MTIFVFYVSAQIPNIEYFRSILRSTGLGGISSFFSLKFPSNAVRIMSGSGAHPPFTPRRRRHHRHGRHHCHHHRGHRLRHHHRHHRTPVCASVFVELWPPGKELKKPLMLFEHLKGYENEQLNGITFLNSRARGISSFVCFGFVGGHQHRWLGAL